MVSPGEIRAEVRVEVEATVSGGESETITAGDVTIATTREL
jgi:hypothetical protein